MAKYAEGTVVPVAQSQDEVDRILLRYGCAQRAWLRDDDRNIVQLAFGRKGRPYRISMPLPTVKEFAGQRAYRTPVDLREAEVRRRFRALVLWLKATLEAVDTGIITFEDAFLAHMALPDGRTVARALDTQVAKMLAGEVPMLAFALPAAKDEAR